ncbi:hypothetical protein B0H63DRAFT_513186 [Podospora didyma]|uniref:Uncharacterized protein n=1 Tax=Podospora didyma TaxID=330526 RepID=A0AAE0NA97_9PEZI|nr:hypothetical protein B0H63DRAFT_513186 [Podospora didyma]
MGVLKLCWLLKTKKIGKEFEWFLNFEYMAKHGLERKLLEKEGTNQSGGLGDKFFDKATHDYVDVVLICKWPHICVSITTANATGISRTNVLGSPQLSPADLAEYAALMHEIVRKEVSRCHTRQSLEDLSFKIYRRQYEMTFTGGFSHDAPAEHNSPAVDVSTMKRAAPKTDILSSFWEEGERLIADWKKTGCPTRPIPATTSKVLIPPPFASRTAASTAPVPPPFASRTVGSNTPIPPPPRRGQTAALPPPTHSEPNPQPQQKQPQGSAPTWPKKPMPAAELASAKEAILNAPTLTRQQQMGQVWFAAVPTADKKLPAFGVPLPWTIMWSSDARAAQEDLTFCLSLWIKLYEDRGKKLKMAYLVFPNRAGNSSIRETGAPLAEQKLFWAACRCLWDWVMPMRASKHLIALDEFLNQRAIAEMNPGTRRVETAEQSKYFQGVVNRKPDWRPREIVQDHTAREKAYDSKKGIDAFVNGGKGSKPSSNKGPA